MGELTAPQPRPRPELVQLLGETLDAIRAGTAAAEAGIERFAGDPEALLILMEWCPAAGVVRGCPGVGGAGGVRR